MRHWKAIGEGLYLWSDRLASGWGHNTLALVLRDGSTLVVNATRGMSDEVDDELLGIGPPRWVLAPNHFHWLGLERFCARHEGCRIVASETAAPRLRRKSGLDFAALGQLDGALPTGAELLEPEALKTGEVWLDLRRDGRTCWSVVDAFFNVPRVSGPMGVLLRLTRTAPGLQLGNTFRWLAVADRQRYKRWLLEALQSRQPTMLVPGHGEIAEGASLWEQLAELAEQRL